MPFARKNPLFDFVIIRFENNEIKIQSFDATVDIIEDKIGKFYKDNSYDTLKAQI